ncbi:MAG TPA: hypothetical protein VFB50_00645 [Chloroflexota bacterium]|nr:hypothetical protein [Chloroflexota bacterium]
MARTNATNYTVNPYPYATAGTDIFKKEDVQGLAVAVDNHDHTAGRGLAIPAGAIPNGTITSAMIANGTIVAADIAAGTITSNEIADGTIATADLANNAVTNAKLGTDTARANLLTNGGFEIWQRGNGPFTAQYAYFADRWSIGLAGTDTISVSKATANIDTGSTACAVVTFTLGSGGGSTYVHQYLKMSDGNQQIGRTISFSCRVNTSTANAVRIGAYSDGTGGTTAYSTFHPGSGAYVTLSVTANVPSDASYTDCYIFFAASCTARLDNATLVVGSVAADYAPLHPADDLARCLRYFETLSGTSTQALLHAQVYSTTGAQYIMHYKASKAVVPTLTTSPLATLACLSATGVPTALTAFTPATASVTHSQGTMAVASGLVAGNTTQFIAAASQTATIYVEANP